MAETSSEPPEIFVIAGPNGSGKTTFARNYLPVFGDCRQFLNADLIAAGLSPFDPEAEAFQAGRLMLERFAQLSQERRTFGIETTLAGHGYASRLRECKAHGYLVHLFFLWLPKADLSVARVADRVRKGGHNIPEDVIRRRVPRSIKNFFKDFRPLVDSWYVFDNSEPVPRVIARNVGGIESIINSEAFAAFRRMGDPT